MQAAVLLFGPSMLLFAIAPPELVGVAFTGMVFANGLGIALHNVNQVTLRQVLTPHELRARVAAVNRTVIFGAIPVGTVIGGIVAEVLGLRAALVVGGVGLCLGAVPYLVTRIRRQRSLEDFTRLSGPAPVVPEPVMTGP
jgi:predicted MFS family arabinose efflux permease